MNGWLSRVDIEDFTMRAEWEIERKFVVTELPERLLDTRKPIEVRQGYLCADTDRHVHISHEDQQHWMSIASGAGAKRKHTRVSISADQFEQLWPLTQHLRVEKQRYRIGFFGHTLMLDVYKGHLAPLMLVEVEFDSQMNSRHFSTPDFAEFEVTHRREYQSMQLAKFGMPDSLAMASCQY